MAGHEHCCGWARLGRVWHPIDLPKGYHMQRGEQPTASGEHRATGGYVPHPPGQRIARLSAAAEHDDEE